MMINRGRGFIIHQLASIMTYSLPTYFKRNESFDVDFAFYQPLLSGELFH